MNEWCRREIERLKDVEKLKEVLDIRVKGYHEFYKPRIGLLNDFFAKHPPQVDITIILDGALHIDYLLAYHIEENNLLFFRPKSSQSKHIDKPFLIGDVHPERTLLLFETDMVGGNCLREVAECFPRMGYLRENIFAYLNLGCKGRNYPNPELMHINDVLKGYENGPRNVSKMQTWCSKIEDALRVQE